MNGKPLKMLSKYKEGKTHNMGVRKKQKVIRGRKKGKLIKKNSRSPFGGVL